jgi:hypothetical protein
LLGLGVVEDQFLQPGKLFGLDRFLAQGIEERLQFGLNG